MTFLAVDDAGAAATLTPQLQVCGCVNGGSCTLDGVFDLATTTSVIANCICPEGESLLKCFIQDVHVLTILHGHYDTHTHTHTHSAYGGQFCEEDVNGCSVIECFEGVECFDVPAPGVGAMCGDCPLGYSGDGEKCIG